MLFSPPLRKLLFAFHLTCSVGWLGAVVGYLVLDLTVATSRDPEMVRSAWIAMGLVVTRAIVPLALASVVTGIAVALGTKWGLLRHWWVVASLVLTVLATAVLLVEAGVVTRSAAMAAASTDPGELRTLPPTLLHSFGGLIVLLVVQILNVYKPRGLTPYGWRKEQEELEVRAGRRASENAPEVL